MQQKNPQGWPKDDEYVFQYEYICVSCFHQATCMMLPIIYLLSKLLIKVVMVEMIRIKNKTCKKTTCCNVNSKNTQSLLISFEN
jgi:hypothetical protein